MGKTNQCTTTTSYATTSAYASGPLLRYTIYLANPRDPPHCHVNQRNGRTWIDNLAAFRQGAAYRNARDQAKEKRDERIEVANGRATSLASGHRNSMPHQSSFSTNCRYTAADFRFMRSQFGQHMAYCDTSFSSHLPARSGFHSCLRNFLIFHAHRSLVPNSIALPL